MKTLLEAIALKSEPDIWNTLLQSVAGGTKPEQRLDPEEAEALIAFYTEIRDHGRGDGVDIAHHAAEYLEMCAPLTYEDAITTIGWAMFEYAKQYA